MLVSNYISTGRRSIDHPFNRRSFLCLKSQRRPAPRALDCILRPASRPFNPLSGRLGPTTKSRRCSPVPKKPMRPCSHPGCNELADRSYCPKHLPQHQKHQRESDKVFDSRRGSAASRGYDANWIAARNIYIKSHPMCEQCLTKNRYNLARQVHHIIPLSEGGSRLSFDNLMALCERCHQEIHRRDHHHPKRG